MTITWGANRPLLYGDLDLGSPYLPSLSFHSIGSVDIDHSLSLGYSKSELQTRKEFTGQCRYLTIACSNTTGYLRSVPRTESIYSTHQKKCASGSPLPKPQRANGIPLCFRFALFEPVGQTPNPASCSMRCLAATGSFLGAWLHWLH